LHLTDRFFDFVFFTVEHIVVR